MDYRKFYDALFAPLEASIGPIDRDTLVAIIGFDMGGPLNFCTIGAQSGDPCTTYVSCELAVRKEQQRSEFGRFELLTSCDEEKWVRSVLSEIGRITLESSFGHGHTMDIGPCVDDDAPLQGVVFEKVCSCRIRWKRFGVLRVIGVSRVEMEYAQEHGTPALLSRLKAAGVYPHALVNRKSVL